MKNWEVKILNYSTREVITTYTQEEETSTLARLIVIGKFRKEYPEYKDIEIDTTTTSSGRKIIKIQSPAKWEFITD